MKTIKLIIAFLLLSCSIQAQHLKKDGTPDRRYKENKTYSAPVSTPTSTKPIEVKDTVKQSAPTKVETKETKKEFSTVQCNGTTKKGAQCKRMVSSSDGYCYQHKK